MVDGGHVGSRRPTALVVAVDEDRRDQLSRELEAAGLEPVLATDGRQAERSAKVAVPDALILDQGLPGLALFRLYSTLRGLPDGAEVPIFFIGQIGIDTPTDHYLDVGLSLREVVDRVRDELGMSSAGPAAPLSDPAATDADAPYELEPAPPAPVGVASAPVTFEPDSVDETPPGRFEPVLVDAPPPATHEAVVIPPVDPTESAGPASEAVRSTEPYPAEHEHGAAGTVTTSGATDVEPPIAAERIAPTVQPPIEPASRAEQTATPAEPMSPPIVTPVVTPEVAPPTEQPRTDAPRTEERSPVPAGDPLSRISRLDVVLLRLGLVLLLLGGAVLLLRPDTSTQPIAPPNLPTATPAATRTASPSPAAHVEPGR